MSFDIPKSGRDRSYPSDAEYVAPKKRASRPSKQNPDTRVAKKTKPEAKITSIATSNLSGYETETARMNKTRLLKKRVTRPGDKEDAPKVSKQKKATKVSKKALAPQGNEHVAKIQKMAYDPTCYGDIARSIQALKREIAQQGEPLDAEYAEIACIVDRYEQLSKLTNFEKKPMEPYERLQLAYYIEVKIPKIENIAHGHFISSTPPVKAARQTRAAAAPEAPARDIYITPKGRIILLAKPELSKIASKGSWKEVFSAVKLYQVGTEVLSKKTQVMKTEKTVTPTVQAVISLSSDEDVVQVDREMAYYKRFNKAKVPGIAKLRFYTDITGLKAAKQDYVHFAKESAHEFETFKMAAFDKYNGSLDQKPKCTDEQKRKICKDVVDAMAEIHAQKVIHGDVKTENILYKIESDGSLTIGVIDFGLSFDEKGKKTIFPEYTYAAGEYGTLFATAPELFENKKYDGDPYKAEVWAVGIALYEIIHSDDVPWKKMIPPPEVRDEMKSKDLSTLLGQVKEQIDIFGEGCLQRLSKLDSLKRLTPEQMAERTICKMLHPDPSQRITMQQAKLELAK